MALDVTLTTTISETLSLVSLVGDDGISSPFSFRLELSDTSPSLDLNGALTKTVAITFTLPGGESQILHGIVTSFGQGAQSENGTTAYFATIEPWFALMRMNSDQRIFQNQTVPQIIQKVFSDLGLSDVKNLLTGSYSARDYCVQFGESTFNFLSRLMESEGIFYFFTHTSSAHTMVLADDASAFPALPNITTIRFNQSGRSPETIDLMTSGGVEQQLAPVKIVSDDFNFITPATDLFSSSSGSGGGTFASVLSRYDYPGLFTAKADGETATGLRLTSGEIEQQQLRGESMCRAFQAGAKFTLSQHFSSSNNIAWILRSVSHQYKADGSLYRNRFTAFPASATFRPPAVTPQAMVRGAQTAIVVGKAGEEIWTDQYGRIKVKFHWDQAPAQDETSSCWIRVAQPWAGKQWGGFFLPRIGQEVIVSFLDGNPDRPIVTGAVYNGVQTVPYGLPDEQTRSTIKSNSSKGGSGFNELRFEDKAGSEEIFMQAQKDMNVSILNDQTVTVANNNTLTVTSKDDKHTVSQGNRTFEVTQGNETYTIGGKRDVSVTGDETHTSKAKYTHKVTGDYTLEVSGNLSIKVTGSVAIQSGTSFDNKAGTALTNKAGTSLTNQAGTSLENKAGTTMSNEAQISIASKANAQHSVESSGILELKGAMVKIN